MYLIEKFYLEIWDEATRQCLSNLPFMHEPFENAISVKRTPVNKFARIPEAIDPPTEPLHQQSLSQQHGLSQEALHLIHVDEPIVFAW